MNNNKQDASDFSDCILDDAPTSLHLDHQVFSLDDFLSPIAAGATALKAKIGQWIGRDDG